MAKNILITTLGHSWKLVPELIGFTNPDDFDFYKDHPEIEDIQNLRIDLGIQPIQEVWTISTDEKKSLESISDVKKWLEKDAPLLKLRAFVLKGISDLTSNIQCKQMGDLIYKVVLKGKKVSNGGKLYLSLAGGRKTMSADMQEAGNIFGCDAMFHIVDDGAIPKEFRDFKTALSGFSKHFTPIVPFSDRSWSNILFIEPKIIDSPKYGITIEDEINYIPPGSDLYEEIDSRRKTSRNIAFNFYQRVYQKEAGSNFYSLYFLDPDKINLLKEKTISWEDYEFVKRLPKADIHCHFGGILTASEIIETALSEIHKISMIRKYSPNYDLWLKDVRQRVLKRDKDYLKKIVLEPKTRIIKKFQDIPEPYGIAGFLVQFENAEDLLDELIFEDYLKEENFKNIGIQSYIKLGDLQGSSLLQSEKTIISACDILKRKAQEHNVKYLEVRCSPHNYTKGGLSLDNVVDLLIKNLKSEHTIFKLIFIATRHKNLEEIKEIINYVLGKDNPDFREIFVGFDLAGNEEIKSPQELRGEFLPILERCLKITIHAGETADAKSIWEAVYHLSADRIGHGLKLSDRPDLMEKIKERKIALELCPSSNKQILDFSAKEYPLKKYLNAGIKATINTDNLGISRTDFSKEYIVASSLINHKLTLWELFQLIKNSFSSAFCKMDERKKLILDAEKDISEVLNEHFFKQDFGI